MALLSCYVLRAGDDLCKKVRRVDCLASYVLLPMLDMVGFSRAVVLVGS